MWLAAVMGSMAYSWFEAKASHGGRVKPIPCRLKGKA
jgi:hypothetical protein